MGVQYISYNDLDENSNTTTAASTCTTTIQNIYTIMVPPTEYVLLKTEVNTINDLNLHFGYGKRLIFLAKRFLSMHKRKQVTERESHPVLLKFYMWG